MQERFRMFCRAGGNFYTRDKITGRSENRVRGGVFSCKFPDPPLSLGRLVLDKKTAFFPLLRDEAPSLAVLHRHDDDHRGHAWSLEEVIALFDKQESIS